MIFLVTKYIISKVMEPDKCEKWEWFDTKNLPDNLFLPFQNIIKEKNLFNE